MQRALIRKDILKSISKGAEDFETFDCFKRQSLQDQFNTASDISEHFLENFYPFKFWARRNAAKPDGELKCMLLGAFEAVALMEEINGYLGFKNLDYDANKNIIDKQKGKLSSAYHTYVTNGQNSEVGKKFFKDYMEKFLRPYDRSQTFAV